MDAIPSINIPSPLKNIYIFIHEHKLFYLDYQNACELMNFFVLIKFSVIHQIPTNQNSARENEIMFIGNL